MQSASDVVAVRYAMHEARRAEHSLGAIRMMDCTAMNSVFRARTGGRANRVDWQAGRSAAMCRPYQEAP